MSKTLLHKYLVKNAAMHSLINNLANTALSGPLNSWKGIQNYNASTKATAFDNLNNQAAEASKPYNFANILSDNDNAKAEATRAGRPFMDIWADHSPDTRLDTSMNYPKPTEEDVNYVNSALPDLDQPQTPLAEAYNNGEPPMAHSFDQKWR
jgi:hypothetical protein